MDLNAPQLVFSFLTRELRLLWRKTFQGPDPCPLSVNETIDLIRPGTDLMGLLPWEALLRD